MVSKIFRAFNSNLEKMMNVSVFLNGVARVPTTWKTAEWIVVMSSDTSWLMLEMHCCSFLGGGSHGKPCSKYRSPRWNYCRSTRQIARKILPERTKFFFLPGCSFLCYFTRGESVQHDVPEKENSDIAVKTFFWNLPEKKIKTSNKLHQIAH